MQSQLDMPARADCTRVFSEKISTRVKERPELEKALAPARHAKGESVTAIAKALGISRATHLVPAHR
ncbi:hypothetical protein DDQ41_01890 [Streptomyces spongiicola]|uniref:Resolvase HTH domain-containing protein n=1 Tax=Streptomyces spongiicola TaxID=1690221 RepID=A0ABN5KAS6_9ACTN|nr:hypothetical protein DDQ41_01890 [Streptomyces spongiicola]